MLSRITVEIDFNNANSPVIQVNKLFSEDVRDKILCAVFEKLGHHSRWFTAHFMHNTMNGDEVGEMWQLVPVTPDRYEEEIKLMQSHRESLTEKPSQG